ncbi:transcriptional repressor [Bacteroidia bacterium]|nr:transcriptional repressor [Bacteroidia bacterium]
MSDEYRIPEEINARFLEYLEGKNLRKSDEREAILKKVCASNGHFDIDSLHEDLHETKYYVSRATLYNTLELFIDAGIVIKHQTVPKAKAEYELRKRAESHIHLVCTKCGKLQEARFNAALFTNSIIGMKTKLTPDYFSIYVYGVCKKCSAPPKIRNRKKG